MDWSVILDIILKALGSAAATTVTALASILFAKLSGKIKDARINNYIKEAVRAAEQLYPNQGTKRGSEKFEYVTQLVLNKFPKLNNAYIKAMIEGAVYALNNQLDATKKETSKEEQNKQESNVQQAVVVQL